MEESRRDCGALVLYTIKAGAASAQGTATLQSKADPKTETVLAHGFEELAKLLKTHLDTQQIYLQHPTNMPNCFTIQHEYGTRPAPVSSARNMGAELGSFPLNVHPSTRTRASPSSSYPS